jgi:hypothetical protein
MIRPYQLVLLRCLAMSALIFSSGCGVTSLQNVFAPDPKLKEPIAIGTKAPENSSQTAAALPADFPLYPQATLQSTAQTAEGATVTSWTTPDPIDFVYTFYQKELAANQWQIVTQPSDSEPQLTAKQDPLSVSIAPQTNTDQQQPGVTVYTISLQGVTTAAPNPTATPTPTSTSEPTPTASNPTPAASPITKSNSSLPTTTADYITDLTKIGVLTSPQTNAGGKTAPTSRVVTRREYARWLVAANNKINSTKPSQQIKLATTDAKPAFQDVPPNNPDFPSIQGLAEAGIIPSPLSGDATAVLFRPEAPLTREQMILWKVPLDTRQPLPAASLDAVKQTWGFQDAGKIESRALRAVIADFQNGEQSNIRRVFGYTTLFQPKKTVTLGEVAVAIWYFGANSEGLSARDTQTN